MMRYLVFYAVDMLLWSAALILVLVLVSRISGHRPTKAQAVWKLLLALYLAAVYNVAGAPELPYIYPRLNINLIPFWDITSGVPAYLINSGLNILLFIPLGFILPLLWKEFRSRRAMCFTGFLLSLGIELAQLLNYRISDVDDLIMNTLGTLVGFLLAKLIFRHRSAVYRGKRDWLELVVINGSILLTTVFVRYPLMEAMLKLI